MLQVIDATDESSSFSDCRWSYSSNNGEREESVAATLNKIYSEALRAWLAKTSLTTSQNDLRSVVEEAFSKIDEVVAVTLSERDKGGSRILEVWVALSENTPAIRDAVYHAEDHMMDRFPERLIEFHVFKADQFLPLGHFEALSTRRK